MNKQNKVLLFGIWLALILMITVATGFTYMAVQQNYRQNSNDPQIELVGQVVEAIEAGAPPDQIIQPGAGFDISKNLSPFAIIFDKDGKAVSSTGKLNGNTPAPPQGTFEYVKAKGRHSFTWQPQEGVRIAAVLVPAKDSFVLVGRNLREVENRIKQLGLMALGAWVVMLGLSVIFVIILKLLLVSMGTVIEENTEVVVIEENDDAEPQSV